MVLVLMGCRSPAQAAEERAKEAAELASLQANAADAEAQRLAVVETAVRKGCKLKASAPVFVIPDDDVRARCKVLVKEGMTAPSSAEFSYEATPLVSDDGCNRTYASSVEGLNAFGVKVRTAFRCTFDPRTGNLRAK